MRKFRGMIAGVALGLLLGGGSSLYAASQVASFPSTDAALRSIYNVLASGIAVSGTTSASPSAVLMTQTPITLSANTDGLLVADAATTPRKHIIIMNIDTGRVTLNFGGAATVGAGITLDPAAVSGGQGGSYSWDGMTLPSNAIHGISSAGTRVAVTVGN